MIRNACTVMLWILAINARAGEIDGHLIIRSSAGQPADPSGAVVYLLGPISRPPAGHARMVQRHKRLLPAVLPIVAGQSVDFENLDPIFHNVFSLSPARPFDLGEYRAPGVRTVRFPRPGIVEVYCNIHPRMAATILVLPNRFFAVTGRGGTFRLEGVPAGRWRLYAWQPLGPPAHRPVDVPERGSTSLELSLHQTRVQLPAHRDKFGRPYRPRPGY